MFNKVLTVEEIQEKLDSFKYSVKFETNFKIKSLADIFIVLVNSKKNYCYPEAKTIYDIPSRRKQCYGRANRSIGDTYRISKYYFPNINYKDVLTAWESLAERGLISTTWCPDVCKMVVYGGRDSRSITEHLEKNNLNFK